MASNIELKMDAQEPQTTPSADRLESNISHAEDSKAPRLESNPSVPSPEATKQHATEKETKKTARKHKKKVKKAKARKPKPVSSDSSSSESEDDEVTNSSSDESTDSDSEPEEDLKKKHTQKKRQDNRGGSKKPSQKPKKAKKKSKSAVTIGHVDTSDSGTDDDHDDNSDSNGNETTLDPKKSELDQLKQQVQDLKRQIISIIGNGASINNTAGLGGGTLGAGHLASGGFGLSGSYPIISGASGGLGLNSPTITSLDINKILASREAMLAAGNNIQKPVNRRGNPSLGRESQQGDHGRDGSSRPSTTKGRGKKEIIQRMDFKRVDHVWDSQLHNYKLQDTAESNQNAKYSEYLFHVRRTFDWEGKYKATVVDIKSKQLREALQDVIGNIKGVSLVDETPKLDPNMLFLYLEDLRSHMNQLKNIEPKGETHKERKKAQKWIDDKRQHLKVLVKYLDKDYAQIKKSLYPMLDNGLITFDLLWALWKPNTLVYTTMYGSVDQPRAFKVELGEKHFSVLRGEFYYIEGKYFEYDGKQFGFGSMSQEIPDFRGARKITSLACYPLKYHKNESQLRKDLIERGKKFVGLGGVHYKSHQGMAYYKKKKAIIKMNINGRIMVDPAIHRRINPNYPVSLVRPKDHDVISDDEDDSEGEGDCGCSDSEEADNGQYQALEDEGEDGSKVKFVTKVFEDSKGNVHKTRVPKNLVSSENPKEKLDKVHSKEEDDEGEKAPGEENEGAIGDEEGEAANNDKAAPPAFSDEEYLLASPVVLGFAFAEKLWLEFTVSGVKEISWNEGAYDSLVLEPKTKDIVKALVESHKYHAAESVDDVIQGKGKGLVAVLHGPPGTGKTLTAEGISELLKCPLYMVSAGDLGTDSRFLEAELQKTLDICHAWGAILLLDEADVFLEKRNMQDIHRNALVSIFLRQLEYFQGILFLTTNRVQTFDDAFQSRIHIALPYKDLDIKAKKAVFRIFIERVRSSTTTHSSSSSTMTKHHQFTEADYSDLARHDLNGRQIKNTVLTAQALAVQQGEPLSMRHIRQVLDVQQTFERDLRGGPGYKDAMRNYY
ncbi:hypothetical protein F5X96DRAFT_332167 [Biscogniauxia mediterranea]|nr:hypothetical protein F5X96DRAFT_332167 [Biscogniauxia mediterranea]